MSENYVLVPKELLRQLKHYTICHLMIFPHCGAPTEAEIDADLAATPASSDHDFSVDLIEKLRKACIRMGIATSESIEECGFKLESMLYALCRAIESWNERISAAPQADQPVAQDDGASDYHAIFSSISEAITWKPHETIAISVQSFEDALAKFGRKVALTTQPQAQPASVAQERDKALDSFATLIAEARAEAEKAIRKFPQPNYVLLKVAEEAGEVVKAGVHFAESRDTAEHVRDEMRQTIAMLYRLWVEGDQRNGVPAISTALTTAQPAQKPEGEAEQQGEPIAWMNKSGSNIIHVETKQRLLENSGLGGEFSVAARTAERYTVPLYAHPPAPQQLTDEDILAIAKDYGWNFEIGDLYFPKDAMLDFARSLLAAQEGGK